MSTKTEKLVVREEEKTYRRMAKYIAKKISTEGLISATMKIEVESRNDDVKLQECTIRGASEEYYFIDFEMPKLTKLVDLMVQKKNKDLLYGCRIIPTSISRDSKNEYGNDIMIWFIKCLWYKKPLA